MPSHVQLGALRVSCFSRANQLRREWPNLGPSSSNRVFHKLAITDNNVILVSYALLHENKKSNKEMLFQWALNLDLRHMDLMFSSLSYWDLCHLEDLSSPYGHAFLIPTKWTKSEIWIGAEIQDNLRISQVAYVLIAQKREHWTWKAEFQGSILTGVTFYCWIFCFASDANIVSFANFVCLWKTRIWTLPHSSANGVRVLTNTQNWQYCISTYLQFPFSFVWVFVNVNQLV